MVHSVSSPSDSHQTDPSSSEDSDEDPLRQSSSHSIQQPSNLYSVYIKDLLDELENCPLPPQSYHKTWKIFVEQSSFLKSCSWSDFEEYWYGWLNSANTLDDLEWMSEIVTRVQKQGVHFKETFQDRPLSDLQSHIDQPCTQDLQSPSRENDPWSLDLIYPFWTDLSSALLARVRMVILQDSPSTSNSTGVNQKSSIPLSRLCLYGVSVILIWILFNLSLQWLYISRQGVDLW